MLYKLDLGAVTFRGVKQDQTLEPRPQFLYQEFEVCLVARLTSLVIFSISSVLFWRRCGIRVIYKQCRLFLAW